MVYVAAYKYFLHRHVFHRDTRVPHENIARKRNERNAHKRRPANDVHMHSNRGLFQADMIRARCTVYNQNEKLMNRKSLAQQ